MQIVIRMKVNQKSLVGFIKPDDTFTDDDVLFLFSLLQLMNNASSDTYDFSANGHFMKRLTAMLVYSLYHLEIEGVSHSEFVDGDSNVALQNNYRDDVYDFRNIIDGLHYVMNALTQGFIVSDFEDIDGAMIEQILGLLYSMQPTSESLSTLRLTLASKVTMTEG